MENLRNMILSEETKVVITITNTILIIVAISGFIWGMAKYSSNFENDIEQNTKLILYNTSDICENKDNIKINTNDNIDLKVSVAGINANLERLIFSVDRLAGK